MKIPYDDPTLVSVSRSLGVKPEWLHRLIQFESRWNPQARSGIPYNKSKVDKGLEEPKYARGLIQFIDSTAIDLGYESSLDLVEKNPTIKDQLLFPVLQYLKKYMPFPTEQSLYLAVFYPAARNWTPSRVFPDSVRSANPGINCPQDYVNKVKGVPSIKTVVTVLLALGLFFAMSKFKI
jgi:hypothetical protein